MENIFDFKKTGIGNPLCLNDGCPKKDDCVRYLAGQHIPDDMLVGPIVLPAAYKNRQCDYFKQVHVVEYAYGFEHIYDDVLRKHYTEIRKKLTAYSGNKGQYYKYKRGERGLSSEQQQYIKEVFEQFGYNDPIRYDRYAKQYEF